MGSIMNPFIGKFASTQLGWREFFDSTLTNLNG